MLGQLYCKWIQSLPTPNCKYLGYSIAHLSCLVNNGPVIVIRSFSSTGAEDNSDKQLIRSFTLSYLMNSCGLTSESAVSASKYVNFKSSNKPDSILRLLRDHGCSNTDISRLIKRNPHVLLANPEKSILPKLEFLESVGVSRLDLGRILSQNPSIFTRSLQKHLIPSHDVLKSIIFVDADETIVKILKHSSWYFLANLQKIVLPNVSILREHGTPDSIISLLVSSYPRVMSIKPDNFGGFVKEVTEMGFKPVRKTFVKALKAVCTMSKSTWENKREVYRRWGWSQDEISLAFKKQPICMMLSEKKISSILDFLVNNMGWKPSAVAQVPTVLTYSLEKRIIPRCSVIRVLLSKGLINEENQIFLSSVVISPDKHFLDTFVSKYRDQVPQLLSIFHREMDIEELGLGFEQKSGAK